MPLNPVPNYPASLDSLPDPTNAIYEDDDGFEIDLLLQKHNAILELLEAKAGISESSAQDTPLANTVLQSLTNGKSKWATIITAMLAANAVSQVGSATGSASSPTTTSTSKVDMTDMSVALTTTGGDLFALLMVTHENNTAGAFNEVGFNLDGGSDGTETAVKFTAANDRDTTVVWRYFTGVSVASHTVKGRWNVTGGTGTLITVQRKLLIWERKR